MRKYLYLTVFISGMASLAIEMLASRLLGNVFGTSNLVWASIIGLILIFLALGYFLGGLWADRSPTYRTFYQILLWAAFITALVPVVSRPVLRIAADAFDTLSLGVLLGSFLAILILLSIPMTLLGTASPFAIRLAVLDDQRVGSTSGKIYAVSTLGSFIGTFLPVLILIPLVGTYRSFLIFSGLLTLVSLIGLWISSGWRIALAYIWMLVFIPILLIFGLPGTTKSTQGQIFEKESAYNYIQVLKSDGYYYLRLNEGQGVHSIYHPVDINYYGPWEQVLVAPFFNSAPYSLSTLKSMAIVGLAAGTTARQATKVYGDIAIDGFEIDPEIVAVGRQYFDMNEPNLNVIVQDGRWGLTKSTKHYQVISIDAYRPPYIPWHLTTVEFFQVVYDHLSDDGVMVINIGRSPSDRRLINTLGSTIRKVFPSIHIVDVPNSFNSILFATVLPTTTENLVGNFAYLNSLGNINPLLLETMAISITNIQPDPAPDVVFTDDLAPIEWITNNMVLNFLIFGDAEHIQ